MSKVPPRPPQNQKQRPANASTPKTPTRRSSRDLQPSKLKAVKVVQPMVTKGGGASHSGGAEDGDGAVAEGPHSDMLEGHAELTEKAVASEHAQEEIQEAGDEVHEEIAAQEERAEAAEESGEANQAGEHKQGGTQETGKKPSAGAKQPAFKHEELSDGFGKTRMDSLRESLTKLDQAQKVAPGTQMMPTQRKQGNDALSALNSAQDPGVYFKELPQRGEGGAGEGEEDPELAEAVSELRTLLADVKGVERVAPGEDEERAPVVLVVATRGFTQGSLARVPERVRRFSTLLAVPYDLLPLRRADL